MSDKDKKESSRYMLLLAHPNILKSKLNKISKLEIEENQWQNAQHLDDYYIWWEETAQPYAVYKKKGN